MTTEPDDAPPPLDPPLAARPTADRPPPDSAEDTPVDRLAAYDRVQTRVGAEDGRQRPLWRTLLVAALVVGALAAAYWFFAPRPVGESGNLLAHLVTSADEWDLGAEFQTGDVEEAQAFVLDQLGWAVAPPALPDLTLVGVAVAAIGQAEVGSATPADVVVPAFRYVGDGDEAAVVYAYDYITLDRIGASFDLPDATYAVLAEPSPVDPRRLDDAFLVTWRRRAILFTAVTESESAFERIGQAVAAP